MQSHQVTVGPTEDERVLWSVALSNGREFHENKAPFERIDGERSPWGRLEAYLEEHKVRITALWLTSPDGTRFNLPTAGSRGEPRFRPFSEAGTPTLLRCKRSYAEDTAGGVEWYTVAVAEYYPTHELQIWVSEHDPKVSWVLTVMMP